MAETFFLFLAHLARISSFIWVGAYECSWECGMVTPLSCALLFVCPFETV
jgi:hypothetical protein